MLISVIGSKGGVGKTVTAIHLAGVMAGRGKVLLVDGDANRSALAWQARGGEQLPFTVIDLDEAESIRAKFDHTIIDTAGGEPELQNLVARSDLVIVPCAVDAMALHALLITVESLREMSAKNFRVLLTLTPPPPSKDAEVMRETLKGLGLPQCRHFIRRRAAFLKAALQGKLVRDVKDAHAVDAWHDYQTIGRELIR